MCVRIWVGCTLTGDGTWKANAGANSARATMHERMMVGILCLRWTGERWGEEVRRKPGVWGHLVSHVVTWGSGGQIVRVIFISG